MSLPSSEPSVLCYPHPHATDSCHLSWRWRAAQLQGPGAWGRSGHHSDPEAPGSGSGGVRNQSFAKQQTGQGRGCGQLWALSLSGQVPGTPTSPRATPLSTQLLPARFCFRRVIRQVYTASSRVNQPTPSEALGNLGHSPSRSEG